MLSRSRSEVEEVTFQLLGLEITVTARRVSPAAEPSPSSPSVGVTLNRVVEPGPPTPSGFILGYDPVDQGLIEQTLDTRTPAALHLLPIDFLNYLVNQLRSNSNQWTPRARIARGFKAGIQARLRLGGEVFEGSVASTGARNHYYICLRGPNHPLGFWTTDLARYLAQVQTIRGEFHDSAVSHGFSTRAESEAYLVGAGRPWPPLLQ